MVLPWDDGSGDPVAVGIPPEAGSGPDQWHTMGLVLNAGRIDIFINDVFVITWTGVTRAVSGHWGPMIAGDGGDVMLVDNVRVVAAG